MLSKHYQNVSYLITCFKTLHISLTFLSGGKKLSKDDGYFFLFRELNIIMMTIITFYIHVNERLENFFFECMFQSLALSLVKI